jgi:hypothetical protein
MAGHRPTPPSCARQDKALTANARAARWQGHPPPGLAFRALSIINRHVALNRPDK